MTELLVAESIKSLPLVVVSATGVVVSWFVGQRILYAWQIRQKSKELQLAAVGEFYRAYGEFFEIWKIWNYALKSDVPGAEEELFARAAAMEGRVEAILVRVASERRLSREDVEQLGMVRQAFQELRQTIRDGKPIRWNYSAHPKYVKLKELAVFTAALGGDALWVRPTTSEAQAALVAITANEHQARWDALELHGAESPDRQDGERSA